MTPVFPSFFCNHLLVHSGCWGSRYHIHEQWEGGRGRGRCQLPSWCLPEVLIQNLCLTSEARAWGWPFLSTKGPYKAARWWACCCPALKGWGGAPAASCAFPFILLFTQSPFGRPASVCLLSAFSQTSPRGCASLGKGCAPRTRECGAAASTADGCRLSESPLSA